MARVSNMATHRANRLLAALEPEDFAFLEPHLEIITLHRKQVLYEAGEIICYTYFPHDAVVSLVNVLEDGGSVEVAVFGREGVFGLISALFTRESFGRYIVQIPGTASQVEIEWLRETVNACPRMRLLLHRFTEALLAQTFQIVTCNAVHSVEARCCRWLLSTHDRVEQDMLPLTHEVLAEMIGTQRPTVSIVLGTLQTAGLISQRRGGIVITDQAGLEDVACECYGKIRRSYERLLPHTYLA
jgi:CRP-like cAMP-binding protein